MIDNKSSAYLYDYKTHNSTKAKQCAIRMLSLILLLSVIFFPANKGPLISTSLSMHDQDIFLDGLPTQSLSVLFNGNPFGTTINLSLTYGFAESYTPGNPAVGVLGSPLVVVNGLYSSPVVGIGYSEMREYPFIFANQSEVTDYWTPHEPSWSSRRNRPVWTEEYSDIGFFTGNRNFSDISDCDYAGTILEFENLTVFFLDGSSTVFGPRIITLGVNFTQVDGIWESKTIFYTSDNETIVTDMSAITLSELTSVPPDVPVIFLSVIGVVAVVLVIIIVKRRDGGHSF